MESLTERDPELEKELERKLQDIRNMTRREMLYWKRRIEGMRTLLALREKQLVKNQSLLAQREQELVEMKSLVVDMARKSSGDDTCKEKKNRTTCTNEQTASLVFMMKEYADVRKFRRQNGWTKDGWTTMIQRLNSKHPGATFTEKQVNDKDRRLEQDHNVVKSILEKSGFGWDPEEGVVTAPDEKWNELFKDQRKWRHKAFPHYDDLCEIYKGKIASGKHCKRTTDSVGKRYTMSHNPEHGSYTAELLRDVGLDSPEVTLSAPGSSMPQYDRSQNIYGDNVDLSGFTVPQGTNVHQSSAVEDQTCVESPQKKRLRNSKGSDEGIEKTKAKRGEYDMLENFVSVREELKTKQIDSCKDIKMVQMERNDPKNDPYWMPSIQKLKTLKLTPSEQDKMMNYLHANPVNPAVFMTVDDAVLAEIIKRAVKPGEEFSSDREHYSEEEDEGEQYGEEKGEEAEL